MPSTGVDIFQFNSRQVVSQSRGAGADKRYADSKMIEQGPATEAEVILAFLKAEAASRDYVDLVRDGLRSTTGSVDIDGVILNGDPTNKSQNEDRESVLATYKGDYLSGVFFCNSVWRRVEIEPTDHNRLKYIKTTEWETQSDESRLVVRFADKISSGHVSPDKILAIREALKAETVLPELIVVTGGDNALVLVEGNSRATAYVSLSWKRNIRAFVSSSPSMRSWPRY